MVGLNKSRKYLITGCVIVLTMAQFSISAAPKRGYVDALGPNVRYNGIKGPIRVAALKEASLPLAIQDQMVKARDSNAPWLICQRRRDYKAFGYTLEVHHADGATSLYPVVGRYDRGLFLNLPSEYVLYYGDCSTYEYRSSGEFFIVQTKPKPISRDSLVDQYGLPTYISWLSPFWAVRPQAWQNTYDLRKFMLQPTLVPFAYGHQLWFSKEHYRLVKDIVTQPALRSSTDEVEPNGYDYSKEEAVAEANFDYGDNSYPDKVRVEFTDGIIAELNFKMVDGLWVFQDGTVTSTRDERVKTWSMQCRSIEIIR